MIELNELYDYADDNDITVMSIDTDGEKCLSMRAESGNCYIGINPFRLNTYAEEREFLSHELGHCATGAFYSRYSPLTLRSQSEHRAKLWQIKKLIPVDELNDAFEDGYIEIWQLAEYFEVSEDLMQFAVDYYKQNA